MEEDMIIFDYMNKNEICSHVEVNLKTMEIKCTDYTDFLPNTVFGLCPHTIEYLNIFFEDRCFPRHRADVDILLDIIGLKEYNPYDIVKISQGKMISDCCWIKFDWDNSVWDDELGTTRKIG